MTYHRGVALCHNGRVMSDADYGRDVLIVDAVSGVTLSDRRYKSLFVDTSGTLLWRGVDNTVIVSSGPNSAEHTLADVMKRNGLTWFSYGVAFDLNECQVLRFDV